MLGEGEKIIEKKIRQGLSKLEKAYFLLMSLSIITDFHEIF